MVYCRSLCQCCGGDETNDADFRVLGPVELWVDGERVDLGPGKQRRVLAVLMVSAGKPVPLAELVDRLWGEAPPAQARNTLYSYIARLRGILRRHLSQKMDPLRRTPGG